MHILIPLLLLSFNALSVNFNQYCQYQMAEEDCSAEFMQALNDAMNVNEPLMLSGGAQYRIERINTSHLSLNKLSIIGDVNNKPIIYTNGLYLFDINNLSINNIKIMGINNEDIEGQELQGNSLLLIGSTDRLNKVTNITVDNVDFENAAEDLFVLRNTSNVTISHNTFRRSGLAMRIAPIIGDPNDLRPRGSGLLFHNVINATINANELYEIKKVAIFIDSEDLLDKDLELFDNYIDMLNFEKPTQRYGLKGGAGIYIANSNNTHNVNIYNNRILNYTMNGMRINGTNIKVTNNAFNHRGKCNEIDTTISKPLVGMAIKAHFLIDAEITNNCIQNTHSGIVLESWDNIENVNIQQNTIYGANINFWVDDQEGGISSNITIENNIIGNEEGETDSSGGTLGYSTFILLFLLFSRPLMITVD